MEAFMSEDTNSVQMQVLNGHLGMLNSILNNRQVRGAVHTVLSSGVNWIQIITVVLPFITQITNGGKIDWAAIVAAILALAPAK